MWYFMERWSLCKDDNIIMATVEPALYCGHHWDRLLKVSLLNRHLYFRGLYNNVVVGTLECVLIIEVSLFQSVLIRLYMYLYNLDVSI